ncbi:MAG: hypothetical protein ACK5LX_02280 [Oscillospiraceae bacterium]
MSRVRVKYRPFSDKPLQHLYLKGDRRGVVPDDKAISNTKGIWDALEENTKSAENLARARRSVRDLILCNWFDLFCTFTFSGERVDRYNYDQCRDKIISFFRKYKERYSSDFRYLIIPEFHKDGGIHFHGMVRGIRKSDLWTPPLIPRRNRSTGQLEMVPNTKEYVSWKKYKLGFFSCSQVKNYNACAKYVAKYVTKDLQKMSLGKRVFFHSQGLQVPAVLFDEQDIPQYFTEDFENEFVAIKDSDDDYGVLGGIGWDECCSDLLDSVDIGSGVSADVVGVVTKNDALFRPLTGKQLQMLEFKPVDLTVSSSMQIL